MRRWQTAVVAICFAAIFIRGGEAVWRGTKINAGALWLSHFIQPADLSQNQAAAQSLLKNQPSAWAKMPAGEAKIRLNAHVNAFAGDYRAAALAWQRSGVSGGELFDHGKSQPTAAEALIWYEMAGEIEPYSLEDWLFIGFACHQLEGHSMCQRFVAQNAGNLLLDPAFHFDFYGWQGDRSASYDLQNCNGSRCAYLRLGANSSAIADLSQCLILSPGVNYRFSAWIRVDAPSHTTWQPVAAEGFATVLPQHGEADWDFWEAEFAAADKAASVCVSPIMLFGEGEAWFRDAALRALD